MRNHFVGHPFRLALATAKLLCVSHLTFTHLIQVSATEGPSMLPSFALMGEWALIDKTARRGRRVTVGDVISYKLPFDPSWRGIKRVIGMPGDYVSISSPGELGEDDVIQVPEGHCWIAGDNLTVSRDSRLFGPLPLALVEGKVLAVLLPWKDKRWIGNGLSPVDNP
ncbi:hypothetical protein CDD80_2820 [Ophiocordyceps camponoti-rufipedis]|uniref:Peptidase S26 domain-containing protein n=1 Tax=Ophiocordyceps camponoti-rufipedis TaxID=2004952 RepID=A0A2C5Z4S4_9HYPO|nr:hypothetical protein CDD80_2820 [Ophiocordyceps camponoti-rufipedis]